VGIGSLAGATTASLPQDAFVQQLLTLADRYEQSPSPEAGLELLDSLIDVLPQAQSLEQVGFVLMAASTVPLSRPYAPFLVAVMERLVVIQGLCGGFRVHSSHGMEAILQQLMPALNRCSECEQKIVVGAYIRACLSLEPGQGRDCLRSLDNGLRECRELHLSSDVWMALQAALEERPRTLQQATTSPVSTGACEGWSMSGFSADAQKLLQERIASSLPHPDSARSPAELRAIGQFIEAANRVNKVFHNGTLTLLHAKGFRLMKLAPSHFPHLAALLGGELPKILKDVADSSPYPFSGFRCLDDLASTACGVRHARNALMTQDALLALVSQAPLATSGKNVPYAVLPTLLVAHSPLWGIGMPPFSAGLCFDVLVKALRDFPDEVAVPALMEAALRAKQREARTGGVVTVFEPGGDTQNLTSGDVLLWIAERQCQIADPKKPLEALAAVLNCTPERGDRPDDSTVMTALEFLSNYPYPLIGAMDEALTTIRRHFLTPHTEALVANCLARQNANGIEWQAIAAPQVIGPQTNIEELRDRFPGLDVQVIEGRVHIGPPRH
jgi:hypothetical protein